MGLGHTVRRAAVSTDDPYMIDAIDCNEVVWAGAHGRLVHDPLRGRRQYDIVVTSVAETPGSGA